MGFLILLLVIAVLWLIVSVTTLKERIERLDEHWVRLTDSVRQLEGELARLQRSSPTKREADVAAPVATPPVPASPMVAPSPVDERADTPTAPPAPTRPPEAPSPRPALTELPTPQPAVAQQATAEPRVPESHPPEVAAAAAVETEPSESWEMVVGTSWLNKIGVFVFVIGVALLVGYSFTRIGPVGRVAIGYALSLGLLGTGVVLERRPVFRNYAYALVAGGWAGVYFTTFAMHDVPAAQIIQSDLAAVTLLTGVAGGMVAHSVRYRSQVVTGLAFIVAYATLALSPLSGFSLAASVPLAVYLLLVSQRLGWPAISALGVIATYSVFVLRGAVFPGGVMTPDSLVPYVTLAAYWLTFEIADVVGLRLRHRSGEAAAPGASVSMLALNAVGMMGATLVVVPADNPVLLSRFLFAVGAAYVGSAVVRAWLMPDRRRTEAEPQPFDSIHAAAVIASAVFVFAIVLRFSGQRESLALLLEAQLLFIAGVTLSDAWVRRMAAGVAGVASAHAWAVAMAVDRELAMSSWSVASAPAVLVLMAIVWYVNRELLSSRRIPASSMEPGYTWAATGLLTSAIYLELAPAHEALAGLVLAILLLEWGIRRGVDYVHQAYLVGLAASYAVIAAFLAPVQAGGLIGHWGAAPSSADEWIVLPGAVVIAGLAAWRLTSREDSDATPWRLAAAGVAATLSTTFVVIFEWRVLSPNAVAPAWALTAVGLTVFGAWRRLPPLRWQGYAVVTFAAIRALAPFVERAPETTQETAAALVVIAAMYAAGYLGRRGPAKQDSTTLVATDPERTAAGLLSLAATAAFVLWKYRVLPEVLVAPAWAATAIVLVALGTIRGRAGQRWQGYALAAIPAAYVSRSLLASPVAAMDAQVWAAVVAALIYGTAWLAHRAAARLRDPIEISTGLLAVATVVIAVLETRVFSDLHLGPALAATGVVMLGLGLWRRVVDLRWHGVVVLALGALRAARPVFSGADTTSSAIAWLAACIGALYVTSLVTSRAFRAGEARGEKRLGEDAASDVLSLGATALLAGLIVQEVRSSMVTLALGLQGLSLMVVGLTARERVMRLSGLALLLACILKLFVYDLRELEALARIFSFVALGLFLLGISWAYTRYREHLSKLL